MQSLRSTSRPSRSACYLDFHKDVLTVMYCFKDNGCAVFESTFLPTVQSARSNSLCSAAQHAEVGPPALMLPPCPHIVSDIQDTTPPLL